MHIFFWSTAIDIDGTTAQVTDNTGTAPGGLVASSPPPSGTLSGDTLLWIAVTPDDTINVGYGDNSVFLSWAKSSLIDVNYILVQNYNDANGAEADWEFCEGGKLQNLPKLPAYLCPTYIIYAKYILNFSCLRPNFLSNRIWCDRTWHTAWFKLFLFFFKIESVIA